MGKIDSFQELDVWKEGQDYISLNSDLIAQAETTARPLNGLITSTERRL